MQVYQALLEKTKSTPGAKVEHNKFCISVHFRLVDEKVKTILIRLVFMKSSSPRIVNSALSLRRLWSFWIWKSCNAARTTGAIRRPIRPSILTPPDLNLIQTRIDLNRPLRELKSESFIAENGRPDRPPYNPSRPIVFLF